MEKDNGYEGGDVIPIDEIKGHIGTSIQAENIFNYLKEINAKTAIIETDYIDRDYLLDYVGFYSRSFEKIERFTTRIHFFSKNFDKLYFESVLDEHETRKVKMLGKYLGFVVLKPFKDQNNELDPQIGRTLLPHLLKKVKNSSDTRNYIRSRYEPNLYGIDLNVEALPFQAQDHAVAACATISLWIANNQLTTKFQTPRLSPIEVTNRAASQIGEERNLPNSGLTLKQMFAFFKSIDLDFEYLSPSGIIKQHPEIKKFIPDTVKAFVDGGIPIVAGLSLVKYENSNKKKKKEQTECDRHAVVICGYREDDNGNITALYVHDDQIGPYSEVENASNPEECDFLKWKNEWVDDNRYGPNPGESYDEVLLDKMVFPLYPKIRQNYKDFYYFYQDIRQYYRGSDFRLCLTTVQELKRNVLRSNIKNKSSILKQPLPKFMWVIRVFDEDVNIIDLIIDATSHNMRELDPIIYHQ
jgi:hypothetical protein